MDRIMFRIKTNMEKITKINGFVYLVKDFERKGFETFYNLGKDIDDPMWKEEVEEMKFSKKKTNKKQKKEED